MVVYQSKEPLRAQIVLNDHIIEQISIGAWKLRTMTSDSLFAVSEQNRTILNTILHSRLIFVKDLNFLTAHIPEKTTETKRFRLGLIIMSTTIVNFGLFLFGRCAGSKRLKFFSTISASFVSAGTAAYIARLISNDYRKKQEIYEIESHIKLLKQFYALVQTVIYNSVIISRSTLRDHTSAYHGHKLFMSLITIQKQTHSMLTLISRTISNGFISLKEITYESSSPSSNHALLDTLRYDETISVNDVYNANNIYQVFQSEYLCWLAITYCPVQHKNYSNLRRLTKEIVNSIHYNILKTYFDLNNHYANYLHERNIIESGVENQNVAGNYHVGLPDVPYKSGDDTERRNSPDQEYVYERRQLTPHILKELHVALKPVHRMHAAVYFLRQSRGYYDNLITIEQEIFDSESGSSSKVETLYNLNIVSPVNFPAKIDVASSSSLATAVSYHI